MKSSVKSGQSQLLIPLLMVLTSAIVFATNVTINMTNQTLITGNMIGIPSDSQEFSFPIEVWADTSIDLRVEGKLVRATLLLDNGSSVSNQRLEFYLNDTLLFADNTDRNGMIQFAIPFDGTIRTVFSGSPYLNPSEAVMGDSIENDIVTEKVDEISITDNEISDDVEISLDKKFFELGEEVSIRVLLKDRIFNLLENRKGSLRAAGRNVKDAFSIELIDSEGNTTEISFSDLGKLKRILLNSNRSFKPGMYRLRIVALKDTADEVVKEVEFGIGLISINTEKSTYHPNETAKITMVVLDSRGHLVSGADVSLMITDPFGMPTYLSTTDGTIIPGVQKGTYIADYFTGFEGNYTMYATAKAEDVESSITSHFLVKDYYEFDIIRNVPATVDPWQGPMPSSIKIIPYMETDYIDFRDFIPASFEIVDAGGATVTENDDVKILTWNNVSTDCPDCMTVSYTVNLPLVTPYMYQLGPAEIDYNEDSENKTFTEARTWLLTADPLEDIGMIAYGEGTQQQPRYRMWDGSTWSSEAYASTVGGTIEWVVLKAIPDITDDRFEEFILGTKDTGDDVNVQVYNGSSWTTAVEVTGSSSTDVKGFDIAYEQLSGDALIVYSNNTRYLSYRVWNGTAWSAQQWIGNDQTTGTVYWVRLESKPGSDEIALSFLGNQLISSMIWNGTAWGNEPSGGLETGTGIANSGSEGDSQAFDMAYEQLSGDLFIAWGLDNAPRLRYATKASGSNTWNIVTPSAIWLDSAEEISISPEPMSNRISLASLNPAMDMQAGIWTGDALIDLRDNIDTASGTWSTTTALVDTGWVGTSGISLAVYQDDNNNEVDYLSWEYGFGWIYSNTEDWTGANTSGRDLSDQLYSFPSSDAALLVYSTSSNELGVAKYEDGWSAVDIPSILENSISAADYEPFYFAFKNFLADEMYVYDIIPISYGLEAQNIESGDQFDMNVSIRNHNSSTIVGNVSLVIYDSDDIEMYSGWSNGTSWSSGETKYVNFSDINTTGWGIGYYRTDATVYWNGGSNSRSEDEAFKIAGIGLDPDYPIGQCLDTGYSMYVDIENLWYVPIFVNITPYEDSVWDFDPTEATVYVPANGINTTVFNLTTPSISGNYNITFNYTYEDANGILRNKTVQKWLSVPSPLITVTREMPGGVDEDTTIYPRFVVHNYGCDDL